MPHYHHRQLLGDHCVPGVGPFLCCDSGNRLIAVQGTDHSSEDGTEVEGEQCVQEPWIQIED